MTVYVVDSSVAIKWYVPEVRQAEAIRLRASGAALHAPDFLNVEVAAILWKKLRKAELTRSDADDILNDLISLATVTRHPSSPLVPSAFDLANRSGRTVYDCLYLALAVQLSGQMVTEDEKLVNSLVGSSWSAHIIKLQDVP
ncbi:MAG TPA: type II toxin-antitoxin system VapC family toxin [Gemmataceae bacterium]|jgi:predicted nucleic acid-binding protein